MIPSSTSGSQSTTSTSSTYSSVVSQTTSTINTLSSTLSRATSTSSTVQLPSSSLVCSPGSSIPTSLPNVNSSVSWCGVAFSNLTSTSEMTACCHDGTVFSTGPCQWCTLSNGGVDTQSSLEGTFSSCLQDQLTSNNQTQEFAQYCNFAHNSAAAIVRNHHSLWLAIAGILALVMHAVST